MAINIQDKTIDNPFLDVNEINEILHELRALSSTRRIDSSHYGSNVLPDNPYVGTINVQFTEEVLPFSVFTIKYVDRQFYAPVPCANWEKNANPATIPASKALVYCTNEANVCKNKTIMPCKVIGDDLPKLIRYTGTLPIIGDRMSKVIGGTALVKSDGGEFVAVSNGNDVRHQVWVVKTAGTFTPPEPLQLLQATDWMDVGGATTAQVWVNSSGNWVLVENDSSSSVAPLVVIAQDIQHRSFLAPGDQCWGKLLGYTDEDGVAIYEVIGENGLHQYGKAVHAVDCGEETTFEVTTGLLPDDTDPTHQSVDWTNDLYDTGPEYLARRKELPRVTFCPPDINHHDVLACTPKKGCVRHIFEGEYVRLRYIVSNRKWEATPIPDTLFATATLYAEMCPDDEGVLNTIKPVGCCGNPSIVIPDGGVGQNASEFSLASLSGKKVFVVYTGEANNWKVLQVKHYETDVVEGIETSLGASGECDSYAVKKRKFALQTCMADPVIEGLFNVVQVEVVISAAYDECDLLLAKANICVLGAAAGATQVVEAPMIDVEVATDVYLEHIVPSSSSTSSGEPEEETCKLMIGKRFIKVCGVTAEANVTTAVDFQQQSVVHSVVDDGESLMVCYILLYVPCVSEDMFCLPIETVDCEASSS